MGNTCSSCFRGSSRELKEEEEQRLQKRRKRRWKTPVVASASVSPDNSTIDGCLDADLENADLPLEVHQPEVAPGRAAFLGADALSTGVKPHAKASAVVTGGVHANATSAVVNSLLLQQQEVAARFVSELLADATKIVASENLAMKDKEDSLATETNKGDTSLGSNVSQAEVVPAAFHQQEVAAIFVSQVLADAAKIVASEQFDELAMKGDSSAREADKGDPVLVSHVNAPSAVDMLLLQQEVATRFVSKLLTDATEIVASDLAQDNVRARESQTEAEPAATDSQVAATLLESEATEAKEKVQDVSVPHQESATTTVTAEKLVDRLVQNSSAEDVVSEAARHSSPQFERPGSADRLSPMSDGSEAWLTGEEDLCDGEDELEREPVSPMEMTEQDDCSLEPPVDILICSAREWRGQMDKNIVLRKGYTVLSHSFGCLRQVRKDNYSALRASLYQLMSTSKPPKWLRRNTFLLIPEELESSHGLMKDWSFPDICMQVFWNKTAVDRMKRYFRLLQTWWQAAAACSALEGRRRICEQLFQGGEEEFGIMEALKLLMLACAVKSYTAMRWGDDVPFLFWLMFGRDSSSCPRTFLVNHLSHVGFSGCLEQMEMSLLAYALQHTIKVYRLHRANTEEFITHYPFDHLQDWPSISLVTRDDHHYNVPVGRPGHPVLEMTEQDKSSRDLLVDILVCSEREWREQLDKNIVIRKGYTVLSHSFRCLRQVREDNWSALRASLYQALLSASQPPDWLLKDTFLLIPEELESCHGLIKHWPFPDICMQVFSIRTAVDRMKRCLGLLQKWWHAAAACSGLEGRRRVCEQLSQGGEEEFGVMEALKLLMLARAVEFYTARQRGDDVPSLFLELFARDSSSCPRTFLVNHLSHVGLSAHLGQMEMFLLGHALQHTIKVYRLHRANTEEFIAHYPVEHLQEWPSICLVTKDDQHYSVPVGLPTHPLWRTSVIGQPAFLQQLDG